MRLWRYRIGQQGNNLFPCCRHTKLTLLSSPALWWSNTPLRMGEAKGVKGETTLKPLQWNSGTVPQGMEMNKPAAGCITQSRLLPLPGQILEITVFKNTLILLASRSTFLLHWLLCINDKLVVLMLKARLGPVCGLGHTVASQETLEMKVANYIQRSMAKKTTVGWKGKTDEWLTAGKVELSDSRACLQQLERCISLDCSASEFPPINAALGRMKVLWLFSKI